jgi:hypothetical protein
MDADRALAYIACLKAEHSAYRATRRGEKKKI